MMPVLRDAATVILVRPTGSSEPFEVLMVKRSARSSFMPDVYVYPGGALDPQDCELDTVQPWVKGLDGQQAADRLCEPGLSSARALGLYIAAMREVFEESGVLYARRREEQRWIDLVSDPEVAKRFASHRQALRTGELSMSELMREEGLVLDLGDVGYFARWVTPLVEKKRFDARFFVVRAPARQHATHDDAEVVAHLWASPSEMLERYRTGELTIAPPTWSTLKRLAACASIDALMHTAKDFAPVPMLPDVHGSLKSQDVELRLPHHPDYDPALRAEHLLPIWDERCQDAPDWQAITRDEKGWCKG